MRLASSIHINYTIANQGRIQELDWGIQTLVQKGVLNFFVANYFSRRRPRVFLSVNASGSVTGCLAPGHEAEKPEKSCFPSYVY